MHKGKIMRPIQKRKIKNKGRSISPMYQIMQISLKHFFRKYGMKVLKIMLWTKMYKKRISKENLNI